MDSQIFSIVPSSPWTFPIKILNDMGLILKDNFIRSFEKRQIMIINEATDFTPPPPPLDPTVLERPDLPAAQTVYENNNLI